MGARSNRREARSGADDGRRGGDEETAPTCVTVLPRVDPLSDSLVESSDRTGDHPVAELITQPSLQVFQLDVAIATSLQAICKRMQVAGVGRLLRLRLGPAVGEPFGSEFRIGNQQ